MYNYLPRRSHAAYILWSWSAILGRNSADVDLTCTPDGNPVIYISQSTACLKDIDHDLPIASKLRYGCHKTVRIPRGPVEVKLARENKKGKIGSRTSGVTCKAEAEGGKD